MKGSKLLKNEYVFSILSRFASVALSLLQSVLVARYLGKALQGVSAYITSITNVGAIVITFGMHQAYPYFRKKLGKDAIFRDYMSLITALYALFLAMACALAFALPVSAEVKAAIILIPFFGYSKIVAYVCLVEMPNVRNLWWTLAGVAEVIFVALLWIFLERGFGSVVAILLFIEAFKGVVYTVLLRPRIRLHRGLWPLAVELGKYGFFPMLALLMTTLNYKIDVLMLRQYSYITDGMIGVYSIGIQMAERIIMIPDTLKGVLVSRLAKGSDEHEVANVCRIAFWSSCLMCLAFLALGRFVIGLLYGAEYSGAYEALLISSFGTIAISYFKLIAQYNIVNKKQILNVAMLSVAIVTDVVFNLLFIPLWGINGAAFATGLGNLVCGLVFVIWFVRKMNIPAGEMIVPQKKDIDAVKRLLRRR